VIDIVPNWHPLWVHFPIALLLAATALYWAARLVPGAFAASLTMAARWNLVLGVLALLPTLLTGYWAYNSVAHDGPSHAAMTRHLYAALTTAGLFSIAAFLAWRERRRSRGGSGLLLLVLLAGALGVGTTGYLGGENVYKYGLGVQRLPASVMESKMEVAETPPAGPTADDHAEPAAGDGAPASEGSAEQPSNSGHGGHDHAH